MFSEELSGNASRKRAEENRARRRQLKDQQAKKSVTVGVNFIPVSTSTDSAPTKSIVDSAANFAPSVTTATAPFAIPPKASNNATSAVERAEEQRQLRAQVARQTRAAIALQSFVRACLSNRKLRCERTRRLEKRLADLSTLSNILKAKSSQHPASSVPYLPPAATTSFAQQLLFVTHTRPQRDTRAIQHILLPASLWISLLQSIVEMCIFPAFESSDDKLNALVGWMDTLPGRRRLEGLIRLALVALFSPDISTSSRDVLARFFRLLLITGSTTLKSEPSTKPLSAARRSFMRHCRSLLLMKVPSKYFEPPPLLSASKFGTLQVPCARLQSPLDLIAMLRYHLMFMANGTSSHPIPTNAKDLRESCIPQISKMQTGVLWTLTLDSINESEDAPERQLLHCRVVSDLFTVPLVSWKLCPITVNALISETSGGRLLFLDVLHSFVELRSEALASGAIQQLLTIDDSISLTICPATPTQCLLANLVQFALVCPAVNGSDVSRMDFAAASSLFTFLTTILDAIPVGTYSSRESSVEWMTDGKGHHTPIVLSSVILDHCKLLLLDSLVRRLFNCAISFEAMDFEAILAQKNDRDLKHEKNMLESGATSASTLAAKEARMDRNRGFWNSSKWARRITKGVSSLLSGEGGQVTSSQPISEPSSSSPSRRNPGHEALVDTSSLSRLLAGGKHSVSNVSAEPSVSGSAGRYDPEFFIVLCRMYSAVLARWGGGGHDDIVRKGSKHAAVEYKSDASATVEACTISLLNVLGFSTQLIKVTWAMIQSNSAIASEIELIVEADCGSPIVRSRSIRPTYERVTRRSSTPVEGGGVVLLYVFVATLVHVLIVTDDIEIHDMDRPLQVHQLRRCIEVLKKLLYRACYLDDQSAAVRSNYFGLALISASSRAMRDLYDRSSRRPISVPKLWLVTDLFEKEIRQCKTYSDFVNLLSLPVLRVCPFLVSFKRRLKIFERIVTTNRIEIQGVNDLNPFNPNPLKPGLPVRITRGRLLEDGLATMNHLGSNMRRRIAVQYVNEAGMQETGIDAGGLFKEFWTDLSGIAFNPNYALFRVTEGAGNCLYPNPSSGAAHGSDHIVLFEFLGRILGKALYEGITIHPRFAHFFLSFLRGDYNYLHMLPDLGTVDPQLYNNLMFLKSYDGDAVDLCLTFTVTNDEFGGTKEIPLIPNGANVEVTSANKQRYIGLVAKYYVVDRVKDQSEAFTRGLWEVIDRSWLRIFNEPELQVLISGASDGKIDVEDLRANAKYVGGYTSLDRNISRFWSVVASMDSSQQQGLLRFVTSCERPPPLGFSSMNPPFTIQRVGLTRDDGKLPTSSTCFNTLKLPVYSSDKVMKERLLYAIQSGAGFELT